MGEFEILKEVINLIADLGFPTAMVIYFIWDKTKVTNQLANAINNNTTVLNQILEHFRFGDENK